MAQSEGRIALALQAYQQGEFTSLRSAARVYDVPHMSLTRRSKGTLSRSESRSINLKLTETKETTLSQWILSMDMRGIPPIQALVREMAEKLFAERI
jgi:hypothetical protein